MTDNITALIQAIAEMEHRGIDWNAIILCIPFAIYGLIILFPVSKSLIRKVSIWFLSRGLEKADDRKLVTLCHPQSVTLFNIFKLPMISLGDSGSMLRLFSELKATPTIEMIINTPGGMVLAAEQIAMAMRHYEGKINVYVPQYAMSGGTLLALAADKIFMAKNAVLGPLDPQLSIGLFEQYPAVSILKAVESKTYKREDKTIILADISQKAIEQIRQFVFDLIKDRLPAEKAQELSLLLTSGTWTHDYAITYGKAKALGLWVEDTIPEDIRKIINKLPQESSFVSYRKPRKQTDGMIRITF